MTEKNIVENRKTLKRTETETKQETEKLFQQT